MTTILNQNQNMRTFLSRVAAVAPLDYERDPETSGGYVAKIDGGRDAAVAVLASIRAAAIDAETSWSRDEEGAYFVWVAPLDGE